MESENVNCKICVKCQRCIEQQGGNCPQCFDCQNCVTAQGGQDPRQQRPDGRQRMGCPPMQGRPQMMAQQMCPQMQGQSRQQPCHMQRGGGQQGLTEAKVKEIVLDVLIAAGLIEDKERKGIDP